MEYIKSSYFIKIIFSFIDDKTKLKIVKYNKSFQNELNINLINYKVFSKRYIIYDSNGKGKEYDSYDDSLIFEGSYKNGQRNGNGKDYVKGKLVFEGEYLKGERHGKGKIYNLNGILIFEGEYLNGEINGKVREYYKDGKLKFDGEFKNDKKWNGKGYDNKNNII